MVREFTFHDLCQRKVCDFVYGTRYGDITDRKY